MTTTPPPRCLQMSEPRGPQRVHWYCAEPLGHDGDHVWPSPPSPDRSAHITLAKGRGTVEVGGVDLARAVQGLNLSAEAGSPPVLTLDLRLIELSQFESDETVIHIPAATRDALVALGWTPPAEQRS